MAGIAACREPLEPRETLHRHAVDFQAVDDVSVTHDTQQREKSLSGEPPNID